MINSLIIDKSRLTSLRSNQFTDKDYDRIDKPLRDLEFIDVVNINRNILMNLNLFIVVDGDYYMIIKNRVDGNSGSIHPIKTLTAYVAYLDSHYD